MQPNHEASRELSLERLIPTYSYERTLTTVARIRSQSERLWGIDYAQHFPMRVGDEGCTVSIASVEAFEDFANLNYATLFEGANDSQFWSSANTQTRSRYLRDACDLFLFHDPNGEAIGLFVGNCLDWCSYYIRSAAFLPRFHGRALYSRFLERLFAILRHAGVARVEADSAPTNYQCVAALLRQRFVASGTMLSEQWGANTHFIRHLDPDAQTVFTTRFCRAGEAHQQKRGARLAPHAERRTLANSAKRLMDRLVPLMVRNNPAAVLARAGQVSSNAVYRYLVSVRYILSFTSPHLQRASELAEAHGLPALAKFYDHKLQEEAGHILWADEDIATLTEYGGFECGGDETPLKAAAVLMRLVRQTIEQDPRLYLAYVVCNEYFMFQAGPDWVGALTERCGVPREVLSVVTKHITADQQHSLEGFDALETYLPPALEAEVLRVMSVTLEQLDKMFEEVAEVAKGPAREGLTPCA